MDLRKELHRRFGIKFDTYDPEAKERRHRTALEMLKEAEPEQLIDLLLSAQDKSEKRGFVLRRIKEEEVESKRTLGWLSNERDKYKKLWMSERALRMKQNPAKMGARSMV